MLLFVLFMHANYGKVVLFKFILELYCSSTVRHDIGELYKVTRHFQMLSTTDSFFFILSELWTSLFAYRHRIQLYKIWAGVRPDVNTDWEKSDWSVALQKGI